MNFDPSVACEPNDDALADAAKALAHPARLALVRALTMRSACCGHLVKDLSTRDLPLAQSTVSQHLRVLVDAGLVTRKTCGVESSFSLNQRALEAVVHALGVLCASDDVAVDHVAQTRTERR